jgi:hypothetical protein
MEEIFSFWLLRLKILTVCVIDPAEVNTVSNRTVSTEKDMRASGDVMNLSFVQDA